MFGVAAADDDDDIVATNNVFHQHKTYKFSKMPSVKQNYYIFFSLERLSFDCCFVIRLDFDWRLLKKVHAIELLEGPNRRYFFCYERNKNQIQNIHLKCDSFLLGFQSIESSRKFKTKNCRQVFIAIKIFYFCVEKMIDNHPENHHLSFFYYQTTNECLCDIFALNHSNND